MRTQFQFTKFVASTLIAGALLTTTSATAATPAEVDAAIVKAKAFLYSQQHLPGGHWENDARRVGTAHENGRMQGDTFGGFTSLATYALLASGETAKDPRIGAAINFLEDADVIGIYSLGLRANVWAQLPPGDKKVRQMAEHDAQLMIKGMQDGHENPNTRGFWEYGNGQGPGGKGSSRFDHSVSQYGVLGLWACSQAGVDVKRNVWETIDAGWRAHQFADGGWTYDSAPPIGGLETPSMTAAGVATLFITDDMLGRSVDCKGNVVHDNIERGLAWMAKNYDQVQTTYAFYGVERIGTASGRKYFGPLDWYADGAEKLVRTQQGDGSWSSNFPGATPTTATSFALLFLARGRQPIMINKLQYNIASKTDPKSVVEGNWNQRPRDVANLVRWTGHHIEHDQAWQIVNLEAPTDDLHDAPILYLSGDQALQFTPEAEAKLRAFCQDGGLILANADCPTLKTAFGKSFEALGNRLFPKYEFRDLPPEHSIFTNQPYAEKSWKIRRTLRGLSNGVRELMILIPQADPSRSWQNQTDFKEDESFQLGEDIYLYAVDKLNLGSKGETYIVHPDIDLICDRSMKVARLAIGDNYDPEPSGWHRIAAMIHNDFHYDIDTVELKSDDKRLRRCKLAHLTGTTHLKLSDQQRKELADYVQQGGTLVVDAAGGSAAFADDAEAELKAMFGPAAEEGLKQPLGLDDPLFNVPGATIKEAGYRAIYRRKVVGGLHTPRLRGIRVGNRIGVYYSRDDISGGMVGEPVDGVSGYSPTTATEIMRNIVLYTGFAARPARAATK